MEEEPVVGDFCEDGGGEAQKGGFVGKDGGDASAGALSVVEWAAFEFLVDAFEGVGGAQAALWAAGSSKSVKPWGRFSSIQVESFGAVVA